MAVQKILVDLENCYGINKLSYEFDFLAHGRTYAIYAPNGMMKSSFAATFQDLSNNVDSCDRIFKENKTKRIINDENGAAINANTIFVIEPYNRSFKSSKISTLLVNKKLKEKYDAIYFAIDEKKEALLKGLKASSGLKSDVEQTIAEAITHDAKEFFLALTRVQAEVLEGKNSQLSEVPYQKIFNDKVLALLESPEFKAKLSEYILIYDQLISSSTFFRKGIFNHNNAADIAKSLNDNGFFKAAHWIHINGSRGTEEIKTQDDLEKAIQREKEAILEDPNLAKSFEEIDKKLVKNKEAKDFREFLEKNKHILSELENLPRLRQKLWVAYLIKNLDTYKELMAEYAQGKEEIEGIVALAKSESTKWQRVLSIFNQRFSVPFIVTMENQDDVILNSEAPNIKFKFKNHWNGALADVEEEDLLKVLSNGELRALYILNIIFEVEARKEAKQETIYIVDDIADSFDYKNKYAIIEYLFEISREENFYQIILTHNFDFYRTVSGRLGVQRENKLHAARSDVTTRLVEERYQKNPFSYWRQNLDHDEMLIASIPFIRNLAEYCGLENHYNQLTSILHIRPETEGLTINELQEIIRGVLHDKADLALANLQKKLKETIYELSDKIWAEREEIIELEKKIVLSMAIRLKLEEYLIKKINDDEYWGGIKTNQTIKLVKKFREKFPDLIDEYKLAEKVNLMTPENIHINSFMYEPILDMSNGHLKQLYREISDLGQSGDS